MNRLTYTDDVAVRLGESNSDIIGAALRLLWAGRLLEDVLEGAAVAGGVRRRGDYEVLTVLLRAGQDKKLPTPVDIANELRFSQSGMTSRLDRLEEAGMIERLPDSADRRLLRIALTESGRRTAEECLRLAVATYKSLFAALGEAETSTFDAQLRRILGRLEELISVGTPWLNRSV